MTKDDTQRSRWTFSEAVINRYLNGLEELYKNIIILGMNIAYIFSIMKVAIPYWQDRVSPVFDVAGHLLLVSVADGREQGRQNIALIDRAIRARAMMLSRLGVNVLICGAISRPLERTLVQSGIEVIAQTCGDVERVLEAFLSGHLNQDDFLSPGARGQGRRSRIRRRRGW